MVSLKDRLKAKFQKKDAPTAPRAKAPPAAVTPHAQAAPDPATSPPSVPERLWNRAYEQAKANNSSTVDAYEKILSVRLTEHDADVPDVSVVSDAPRSTDLASQQNAISQNADKRRMQMQQLVQHELRKTEKDANVKQGVGDGIQAAMAIKEVVNKAVQASPEAAVAWISVCFALEILMNPLTQASSNRQGIAYVVSRMDWYWNLSSLLLDENMTEAHSKEPRSELEEVVTQLYAKLLLYQMKSVCYYHRSRFATFMRDLVQLENWDGELSDIQAAETAVREYSTQYNTALIRARLGAIAETAKSQNAKLDSIGSAVREQTRQQERMHETSEDNRCLKDLRRTDPHDDKKRIEGIKGGLLKDAYRWVLDHPDFRRWRDDAQTQLLWVKADPGKGKTMLLCGIIDELQESVGSKGVLSYFFCQTSEPNNSATAALRGLLFMLASQQPSLVSHVRKKYDRAGKSLFEDANAWIALTEIFADMLQDPSLNTAYLLIDALDECVTDLPKLLDFVAKQSSASPRVKWIVSSRNWPSIEEQLEQAGHKVRLSLERNPESVSTAVRVFIDQRVSELAQQKKYDKRTESAVLEHLVLNANDTFLWVALVCKELQKTANRNVLKKLDSFPPELDALYERMMQQMSESDDAEICRCVLASNAILYRPVTISELVALVEQLEDVGDDVREIISLCGSFLTLREDTVYFVHQSAKDFLFAKASSKVFPGGAEDVHQLVFSKSLATLSRTLHRDMYSLKALGSSIEDVEPPSLDPLAASRYPCIYWIDHLRDSKPKLWAGVSDVQVAGVSAFLQKKYLYWLEGLSLCKSVERGVVAMTKLWSLVQEMGEQDGLTQLVQDARRFIMYHKGAIEGYPLQTYASALLFSPTGSLIRRLFQHEAPKGIYVRPTLGDSWSACLQTLEGHSDTVTSVAFSHDSTRLASASFDSTVKIWDTSSGGCLQTLEGHSKWVSSVVFSHDSTRLASASYNNIVKIWDVRSGACLQTLKGHSNAVTSVAFSHDSTRLASASYDNTVKIWDTSSGACLQTLKSHKDSLYSVAFSHDSTRLASASNDNTVKIWDASSGACLQTLEGHSSSVYSVAFSHESTRLASASDDSTVKIWDASSGACLQTLEGYGSSSNPVAFSHNSTRLASVSHGGIVKIWDASSGGCLQTLEGHSDMVDSVAFSHDSTRLASSSYDNTVKIWDASSVVCLPTLEGHSGMVSSVAFSHDSTRLVSASYNGTIKIWDVSSGACLQTLEDHSDTVRSVAFSHDSTRLAAVSDDRTAKIWDTSSGVCRQTIKGFSSMVESVAFSHDSTQLASASHDGTAKIWDASSGACLHTLEGHSSMVESVAFSHDSTQLASASDDNTVKIWDASSGACLQTLEGHSSSVYSVAFSHESTRLASASYDNTVRIWDASSGGCLQTLEGHSRSVRSAELISSLASLYSDRTVTKPQQRVRQGIAISLDDIWISDNAQKLLWLPTEYRPERAAVSGRSVGIGTGSGKIWICFFE